uniref:Type 1 phosphatases regulator n=1 Tax=Blastobotrys adeninivorans TaxID=409370 RepID=A0A060T9Y6_BLAAD
MPESSTRSATTTITEPTRGQLRLQGSANERRVRWTEDVVDNEHMNKKKSKICCIFHPQREFGESSEEELSESSGSDSDSDSDSDAQGSSNNKGKAKQCKHRHHHDGRPNAYERQPTYKKKT